MYLRGHGALREFAAGSMTRYPVDSSALRRILRTRR
jgi:hypothetical protein